MSVPAYRRNLSKIEFLNNFDKIRRDTYLILMRDFGVKKKVYEVKTIEKMYNINSDDKVSLEAIMQKYNISSIDVDKYPEWLINKWREMVLDLLSKIGTEIRLFNSIYMSKESLYSAEQEYLIRRQHITNAIGYLFALKDRLQEIIVVLDSDASIGAYAELNKKIDHEITLLKGVRQSDNKLFEKIKASFTKCD